MVRMRMEITREQFKELTAERNSRLEALLQAYTKVFVPLLKKWDGKVYNRRFLNAIKQEMKTQGYGNYGEIGVRDWHRCAGKVNIYLNLSLPNGNSYESLHVALITKYWDGNNRISESDTLSNELTKAWLQDAYKSIQQRKDVVKNWNKYMRIANRLQEAVKAYNALPGCFTNHVERWQFDVH